MKFSSADDADADADSASTGLGQERKTTCSSAPSVCSAKKRICHSCSDLSEETIFLFGRRQTIVKE